MNKASRLTRRQQQIYEYLLEHGEEFEHPPTLEELGQALGVRSRGSLHKHISALVDAGLVEPMDRQQRGIRLTPSDASGFAGQLPMLGKIAAGRPLEAIAAPGFMEIPPHLRTPNDCYVLQVEGDSMIEDGILDGDWIIVESCSQARNGDMVVALVDQSEVTVKRIQQRPGEVLLCPANSMMAPMSYPPDRVLIQGVVVGQMRSYR